MSQLAKFNPKEEGGCHRRWALNYVFGQKEPFTRANEIGVKVHAQLDHWLTTGSDVLGVIAKSAQHHYPLPGKDLLVEWGFNDRKKPANAHWFPPEQSLLRIGGVPLIGFMDLVNPRGAVGDPEGTVEVIDHKTTSNLIYIKPKETLINTSQMAGYAAWARRKFPNLTGVRLTHVGMLSKEGKTPNPDNSRKESAIVSVDRIVEREVEMAALIAEMREVGRAKSEDEIPIVPGVDRHPEACKMYPRDGCPFKRNCFKSKTPIERLKMGLLDKVKKNGVAATPPLAVAQPEAPKVERKMPRIEDEVPSVHGPALEQGATYLLPTGVLAVFNTGTNGKNSFTPVVGGPNVLLEKTAEVRKIDLPPQPKVEETVAGSAPVAAKPKFGTKVSLKKPEAPAPAPAAEVLPTIVPPDAPKAAPPELRTVPVDENGNELPEQVEAPKKRGRPKKSETTEAPVVAEAGGIRLFINAIPSGPFEMLDGYVGELTNALQEAHKVSDIRFPPDANHALGFNRWRGALAEMVKKAPPEAGSYVILTRGSELNEVVAETLALLGSGSVVRGV